MTTMVRTTITIDQELADDIDAYIERSDTLNRSEAIRDLVRRGLSATPEESPAADCVGIVSYVIDQKVGGLAKQVRLERLENHNTIVTFVGVPVDHTSSIDVVLMRGKVAEVSDYASRLFLKRGVRHGSVSFIPVGVDHHPHRHGEEREHTHMRVQNSF